jgi:hypothetical protein
MNEKTKRFQVRSPAWENFKKEIPLNNKTLTANVRLA